LLLQEGWRTYYMHWSYNFNCSLQQIYWHNENDFVTDITRMISILTKALMLVICHRPVVSTNHMRFNPSHTQVSAKVKGILRSAVSRPVCSSVRHPSGTHDKIFITVRLLRVSWYGAPSMTRGRVCSLQLLMSLASTVILGYESRGAHDRILLSKIWDSPNLEGQVPVFISPRNRVAEL
jgi:hypothetical protein